MHSQRPPATTDRDLFISDVVMRCRGATVELETALLSLLSHTDLERLARRLGKSADQLAAERAMARVRITALLS
jgi:hypothetical protein